MNWQEEYPTIADVNHASFDTLRAWSENLPDPQTDVEKAVRRRIVKKMFRKTADEVKKKAPDLADKWNDLADTLKDMGVNFERM